MRVIDRESHSAAYAKSWEAIEAFLAVAGATETVLALEERALVAGLRAEANRLANADHANLVRQSRTARAPAGGRAQAPRAARSSTWPRRCRMRPSSGSATRRSRCGSWRRGPTRPVTKAAMAGRLARVVELAERSANDVPAGLRIGRRDSILHGGGPALPGGDSDPIRRLVPERARGGGDILGAPPSAHRPQSADQP